jgi:hypothetical protein
MYSFKKKKQIIKFFSTQFVTNEMAVTKDGYGYLIRRGTRLACSVFLLEEPSIIRENKQVFSTVECK